MDRTVVSCLTGRALTMALASLALILAAASASGTTLVVDDDGGPAADARTIQEGVDMASAGDVVRVLEGQYASAVVNVSISLVGDGANGVIVRSAGTGLWIGGSGVNVSGISVAGDDASGNSVGIRVTGDRAFISGCAVSGFETGVSLEGCAGSVVSGVAISDCARGVALDGAVDCEVIGCDVDVGDRAAAPASTRVGLARDDVVRFAASADQHYGHELMTVPAGDGETVDAWMEGFAGDLDFVIASMGDWISDNRAAGTWQDPDVCWDAITGENADSQRIPYFWVFGNHDITNYDNMTDGNPVRKEMMGRNISGMNENNYAFMYDNVLFISAAQASELYMLTGFQMRWIEHLVGRYSDHATVIMSHQAIFETTGAGENRSSSWTADDYGIHNDVSWWRRLFRENPQIILYVHGHKELGHNTTVLDAHRGAGGAWDDHCTFALVPSNGRGTYGQAQLGWSYVFEISDGGITIECFDEANRTFIEDAELGVPYARYGMPYDVTDEGMEWFSIPKRLLDGQAWTWENHFVAAGYRLELIGTCETEQLANAGLDGFDRDVDADGYWYAVRGDEYAMNKASGDTDGHLLMPGGRTIEIATSPSNEAMFVEGAIPYTTAVAVPGKEYELACQVATLGGDGSIDLIVNVPRYLDLRAPVLRDEVIASDVPVNGTLGWVSARFTVPDDLDAWFIQPKVRFDKGAGYVLEAWSLRMVGEGNATSDFSVSLGEWTATAAGSLGEGEFASFPIVPGLMANDLSFRCSIGGNRVGIVALVYERPQLWSDDVTFGILDDAQTLVRIEDRSPHNRVTTVMAFEGAALGMADGFGTAIYHHKFTYLSGAADPSIDGTYDLRPVMSTFGALVSGGSGDLISRLVVKGADVGVLLSGAEDCLVEGCVLIECRDIPIACVGSAGCRIEGNTIVVPDAANPTGGTPAAEDVVVTAYDDSAENGWTNNPVIAASDYARTGGGSGDARRGIPWVPMTLVTAIALLALQLSAPRRPIAAIIRGRTRPTPGRAPVAPSPRRRRSAPPG